MKDCSLRIILLLVVICYTGTLQVTVAAQSQCAVNFPTQEDLVTTSSVTQDDTFFLFPSINFTCSVHISGWVFAGRSTGNSNSETLEIQTWRLMSLLFGSQYNRISTTEGTTPQDMEGGLYQFMYNTPIEVMAGDVLGIRIPESDSTDVLPLFNQSVTGEEYLIRAFNPSITFIPIVMDDEDTGNMYFPLVVPIIEEITMPSSSTISSVLQSSSSTSTSVITTTTSTASTSTITPSTMSSSIPLPVLSSSTSSTSVVMSIVSAESCNSSATLSQSSRPPTNTAAGIVTFVVTVSSLIGIIYTTTSSIAVISSIMNSPRVGVNDTNTSSSSPTSIDQSMLIVVLTVLVIISLVSIISVVVAVIIWRKRKINREDMNIITGTAGTNTGFELSNEVSCDVNPSYGEVNHLYMSGSRGRSQPIEECATIEGDEPAVGQNVAYDTVVNYD